jgi:hypothetical protein
MEEFSNESREQGEHGTGSKFQLIQLLLLNTTELIRQHSLLTTALRYNSCFTKSEFTNFHSTFLEVYQLSKGMLPSTLVNKVEAWIKEGSNKVNADTDKKGLKLADELIQALQGVGLLQLFEEPIAPPFMSDVELEEYEEKLVKA